MDTRPSTPETARDGLSTLRIEDHAEGAILAIQAMPRASRSAVEGVRHGALLVRVTAPPLDDAANRALLQILAQRLGLPRHRLRLVQGTRTRTKSVQVLGLSRRDILARLDGG